MLPKEEHELVSVVIPVFNRARLVSKALDSVMAQDYPHLEVIVVNDGSTDDISDVLSSAGERIQVITTPNRGVSAARNAGISKSRGRFVALLDSDDTWTEDKISTQMEFFSQNPDALICQTEEIWIRNGRRVNPGVRHKKPSGLIFEPSLHLCLVSPSAVMMKKHLFDLAGMFDETFPVCEDYDLWLRISAAGIPIYLIDRPCTIKTGGHDDQLSKTHSQDKYRIRSILKLLESKKLSGRQAAAAEKVLEEKCRIYGQGCMKRGKTQQGAYYLDLMESIAER